MLTDAPQTPRPARLPGKMPALGRSPACSSRWMVFAQVNRLTGGADHCLPSRPPLGVGAGQPSYQGANWTVSTGGCSVSTTPGPRGCPVMTELMDVYKPGRESGLGVPGLPQKGVFAGLHEAPDSCLPARCLHSSAQGCDVREGTGRTPLPPRCPPCLGPWDFESAHSDAGDGATDSRREREPLPLLAAALLWTCGRRQGAERALTR